MRFMDPIEFTWRYHEDARGGSHWMLRADGLPTDWWVLSDCQDGSKGLGWIVMRGANMATARSNLHRAMLKAQQLCQKYRAMEHAKTLASDGGAA